MAITRRGPIRAVIYCRISLATHGDRTKVARQEKLCRRLAKRLGWEVVVVYSDNNRSAWQRNRKREGWDAMLLAIEKGEADAVIVYHGDRLIRQPWDLETLLSLADGRGIRLASPSGTRDLDDADHRYQLRLDVAAACRESDRISKRTQDAHADRAERGVVKKGGMRPFGYKRSGKILDDEAELYREAVARVLAGESRRTIVHDWNQRGVLTTKGNPWVVGTLSHVLKNPRYAGLSTYKGEIVGKGKWKALIERETWEALQATLGAMADHYGRRPGHTSTSKYLLTYIAFHAGCGSTMQMHHNGRGKNLGYVCSDTWCKQRVTRNMANVDAFVIGRVLRRLSDPRLWAAIEAPVPEDNAGAELAALEKKRRDTEAVFERSLTMTPEKLEKLLARLDEQIAAVRERIAARGNVHVLAGCRGMTREQWDALPLDRRRAIVKATVTVEILPSKRGRGFDPESVRVLPVEQAAAAGTE